MSSIGSAIGAAIVAYVATNLDDFMVLIVFFAQVKQQQSATATTASPPSTPIPPSMNDAAPSAGSTTPGQQSTAAPEAVSSGNMRAGQVICGQFFGFTILVALSLLGLVLGLFIEPRILGFIGIFPLLMGLWMIIQGIRQWCVTHNKQKHDHITGVVEVDQRTGIAHELPSASPPVSPSSAPASALTTMMDDNKATSPTESGGLIGSLDGRLPTSPVAAWQHTREPSFVQLHVIAAVEPAPQPTLQQQSQREGEQTSIGISNGHESGKDTNDDDDDDDDDDDNCISRGLARCGSRCPSWLLSPNVLKVAVMTVANGGDNIGIYLPLFASLSDKPGSLITTLIVFYILVGVWCAISYALIRCKFIARTLGEYGHYIVPLLLIALGIYVMYESESFELLE
jgi:cadmium resistance protein CadD (predicted permease)